MRVVRSGAGAPNILRNVTEDHDQNEKHCQRIDPEHAPAVEVQDLAETVQRRPLQRHQKHQAGMDEKEVNPDTAEVGRTEEGDSLDSNGEEEMVDEDEHHRDSAKKV